MQQHNTSLLYRPCFLSTFPFSCDYKNDDDEKMMIKDELILMNEIKKSRQKNLFQHSLHRDEEINRLFIDKYHNLLR